MMVKKKDRYEEITYNTVFEQVNSISALLYSKGLRRGDKAALLIENCPEYICFDQALMQLGVVNVSIYPTLGEPDIEYIINDSGAKCILVGTPFLLRKINKIKVNCPNLEFVIAAYDAKTSDTFTYHNMIDEGKKLYTENKNLVEAELEKVGYEDLCINYSNASNETLFI
jgi:long-chain acyl-CoA synthetase